jgi:hypothetical protein
VVHESLLGERQNLIALRRSRPVEQSEAKHDRSTATLREATRSGLGGVVAAGDRIAVNR